MKNCYNKLIPDPGKCFMVNGEHVWTVPNSSVGFEEVEIGDSLRITPLGVILGEKFLLKDDINIKKYIISRFFSNDDQIAIMLNHLENKKDKEAKEMFNFMSSWRSWADELINRIKQLQ